MALTVSIRRSGEPYSGSELLLVFCVRNDGEQPASFCRYMTPLEGFCGNILQITDGQGQGIPYRGILKKRAAPGPEDEVLLQPGQQVEALFDLLVPYPLPSSGEYEVLFVGSSLSRLPSSPPLPFHFPPT